MQELQMNDHHEPMQEVMYKGKRIQFKVKHFPGNEQHLTQICEGYFRCKPLEDTII